MSQASQITLDAIIKDFLIEKGYTSEHGYQRYLNLAIRGLKELNYDVSGQLSYIEVKNHDYSIPIPDDCLNVVGIMFNSNGMVIRAAKDSLKAMSVSEVCGVPVITESNLDETSSLNFAYYGTSVNETKHWRNNENVGGYFNALGGNRFVFQVNEANNTIELSSNMPSTVILEYLPTAKQINGQFYVHPFLQEPIMAWLRYSSIRGLKGVSRNEVYMLQKEYVNAKDHLRKRLNGWTVTDFINAVNRSASAIDKFA